jgi:hypothetical protein
MTKLQSYLLPLALLALPVLMGSDKPDQLSVATAPPVVVRTIPQAGSDNVDPSLTEIKVTFSKDMISYVRNRSNNPPIPTLMVPATWFTLQQLS